MSVVSVFDKVKTDLESALGGGVVKELEALLDDAKSKVAVAEAAAREVAGNVKTAASAAVQAAKAEVEAQAPELKAAVEKAVQDVLDATIAAVSAHL